jgi:hypothetical protein
VANAYGFRAKHVIIPSRYPSRLNNQVASWPSYLNLRYESCSQDRVCRLFFQADNKILLSRVSKLTEVYIALTVTCLGEPSIATIFISYSPIHITTCFHLYRPSSSEIYTVVFRSYYAYNGFVFRLYSSTV